MMVDGSTANHFLMELGQYAMLIAEILVKILLQVFYGKGICSFASCTVSRL